MPTWDLAAGHFRRAQGAGFVDGRLTTTLKGEHIVAEFIGMVDAYVASHYAGPVA